MYSQEQKCFHFRFVLASTFMLLTASTQALSVPQGCVEVAKSWMVDSDVKFDTEFLNNFVHCVGDMYKLYKETNWDWKTIQKVIPLEIRDVIQAVPKMTKTELPLAGKAGLQFMSAYLFYKTVELYARASALEVDQEFYRKEFEILRAKKLQPIMDLIDREDSATLKKFSEGLIEQLNGCNQELRGMLRVIYKDYKTAECGKIWSVAYSVGSITVCAGSLTVGFPVCVVPCILAATGVIYNTLGHLSLSNTAQQLETLIDDVETTRNEIEEYRTRLFLKFI